MYFDISDKIKKNCLSAGAIPDIGCSTKTTEYSEMATIKTTVKQKVSAIENLISASACSGVIDISLSSSRSGFISRLSYLQLSAIDPGKCRSLRIAVASILAYPSSMDSGNSIWCVRNQPTD
jgi:hypothetical protein